MPIDRSKYQDTKYLKWLEQTGYVGWQFAFEHPPLPETKFFNVKKFGGEFGAYEKAIEYRNNYIETAKALGIWDLATESQRLPLNISLSRRNTSGIVGVSRKSYPRPDRITPEEQWLANFKNKDGKQRQEKFTISVLGEKQALYKAIEFRKNYVQEVANSTNISVAKKVLETHIEELNSLMEFVEELNDNDLYYFVKTINDEKISNTEKQIYLTIRVGQQLFRKRVLEYWKESCAITGAKVLLTAAHIKPWSEANSIERIDVNNGVALSPIYDKAFDFGFISFTNQGDIILSKEIQNDASKLGITGKEKVNGFNQFHFRFLEYHRQNIFIQ